MAGVTVPSVVLLLIFAVLYGIRFGYNPGFPIERILVFPLALVPAIWGAWNVAYLAMHNRRYIPLGAHGALVPLFLAPLMLVTARALGVDFALSATLSIIALGMPLAMIAYYLVWKFIVGFLNEMLGIA